MENKIWIRPLDWYLNQNLEELTPVQKIIVTEMKVLVDRKILLKRTLKSYLEAIDSEKKYLQEKNYKKEIIYLIVYKVYDLSYNDLLKFIYKMDFNDYMLN